MDPEKTKPRVFLLVGGRKSIRPIKLSIKNPRLEKQRSNQLTKDHLENGRENDARVHDLEW